MSDRKTYNVVPDIRLLVDIGSANYTVPEAISELVANSMDARYEDSLVKIEVTITSNRVEILDNGRGMTADVLGAAMRLSAMMDEVTGNIQERKGMYGLGMKAACSSLGKVWRITTRPNSDKNQYSLVIDLDSWLSKTDRTSWVVEVETSPFDPSGPLAGMDHGTSIVVEELRENFTMATAVSEKLSMAYKPHLESGDSISVNGSSVEPKQYDLIDDRKWEIDLEVGEHRIKGWFGLDKKTHNDGYYGINIYRQQQLVESWNKDFFRAHLMSSRVVGEIDLPFIRANFHKLGIDKGSEEWKLVVAAMKELMKPAVKASSDMAKNKNDDLRQAKAIRGLDWATGIVTRPEVSASGAENDSAGQTGPTPSVGVNPENADSPIDPSPALPAKKAGFNWQAEGISLVSTFAELAEERPWDYIFDSKSNELLAVVNVVSPVYLEVKDEEFLGILALAEAVMGFLINERGYKYDAAREERDQWLSAALSRRSGSATKSSTPMKGKS